MFSLLLLLERSLVRPCLISGKRQSFFNHYKYFLVLIVASKLPVAIFYLIILKGDCTLNREFYIKYCARNHNHQHLKRPPKPVNTHDIKVSPSHWRFYQNIAKTRNGDKWCRFLQDKNEHLFFFFITLLANFL